MIQYSNLHTTKRFQSIHRNKVLVKLFGCCRQQKPNRINMIRRFDRVKATILENCFTI